MYKNKKLEDYLNLILSIVKDSNFDNIDHLFERLESHFSNNGRIFLVGNGGSAAVASHAATDLSKLIHNNNTLNAISLNSNISLITALSNDEGYENVFSNIIKNYKVNKLDTLITISSSGNSDNLINLINGCSDTGVEIFSLLGFDGGEIKNITKYPILASSKINYYGPIEDIHMMIFHLFSHSIKKDLEEINYQ